MQKFKARIGTTDSTETGFDATLAVGGGQLVITVGDQEIGAWPVGSVELDLTSRGYRMNVQGEALLVSPVDRFTFREAVDAERQTATAARPRWWRKADKAATKAEAPAPFSEEVEAATRTVAGPQAEDAAREKAAAKTSARSDPMKVPGRRLHLWKRNPPAPVEAVLEPQPVVEPDAPWEVPVQRDPVEARPNPIATWFEGIPLLWKIGVGGSALAIGIGLFFPRMIATILLIPGLLAVMTAGLGLVDPGYTSKLPASFDEQRLLTVGGILLAIGLLIVTFF